MAVWRGVAQPRIEFRVEKPTAGAQDISSNQRSGRAWAIDSRSR